MIVAVHALVGAALSRLCRTRAQAFVLGFLSHLPCDLVPHRDLDLLPEALLLGATLGLVGGARGPASKEFCGALGASAADLENAVARALNIPDEKLLLPTHSRYHGRKTRGFGLQIALALATLAVVLEPAANATSGRSRRVLPGAFAAGRGRRRRILVCMRHGITRL